MSFLTETRVEDFQVRFKSKLAPVPFVFGVFNVTYTIDDIHGMHPK